MDWVRRAFGAQGTPLAPFSPAGRHAVVAAILREGLDGAEVLLIRRAEDERDPWSGHMALPGGYGEARDADLVETAVREVGEEVGLDLARSSQLLGRLPETRAVSQARPLDFGIFPLVFALEAAALPTPNPLEVQQIVWASIDHLLSPSAHGSYEYLSSAERHVLPAFDVNGQTVWGLTYRILRDLLGVLAAPADADLPNA